MKITINQLEYNISDGVVTKIYYTFSKDKASISDFVVIPEPPIDLIPFDELTEIDVINWLSEQIVFDKIEKKLDNLNTEIETPKKTTGLPWQSETTESAQANELPS
jgi:hypothetical protein